MSTHELWFWTSDVFTVHCLWPHKYNVNGTCKEYDVKTLFSGLQSGRPWNSEGIFETKIAQTQFFVVGSICTMEFNNINHDGSGIYPLKLIRIPKFGQNCKTIRWTQSETDLQQRVLHQKGFNGDASKKSNFMEIWALWGCLAKQTAKLPFRKQGQCESCVFTFWVAFCGCVLQAGTQTQSFFCSLALLMWKTQTVTPLLCETIGGDPNSIGDFTHFTSNKQWPKQTANGDYMCHQCVKLAWANWRRDSGLFLTKANNKWYMWREPITEETPFLEHVTITWPTYSFVDGVRVLVLLVVVDAGLLEVTWPVEVVGFVLGAAAYGVLWAQGAVTGEGVLPTQTARRNRTDSEVTSTNTADPNQNTRKHC